MTTPTPRRTTRGASTTPTYSVTLVPGGPCYVRALSVGRRIAALAGLPASPRPHVTLQVIYGPANPVTVRRALADIAAQQSPFAAGVAGVGVLVSPTDPERQFLHASLTRIPEIVDLYRRVTQRLQALGLQTYSYSEANWVPHLSIVSGQIPRHRQHTLLHELGKELGSCIFVFSLLQLSRSTSDGTWSTLATLPLGTRPRREVSGG